MEKKLYSVDLQYTDGSRLHISQDMIDNMLKARPAIEMIAEAISVANHLSQINNSATSS